MDIASVPRVAMGDPLSAGHTNQLVEAANKVFKMTGLNGVTVNGDTFSLTSGLNLPITGAPVSAFLAVPNDSFLYGDLAVIKSCKIKLLNRVSSVTIGIEGFDVDADPATSSQFVIVNKNMEKQNAQGSVFLEGITMARGKRPADSSTDIDDRFIGANPVSGQRYLELSAGPGVFEVIAEEVMENGADFIEEHMIVIRFGRSPLPELYEATADAADNIIPAKRLKSDGTLIGDAQDFWSLS